MSSGKRGLAAFFTGAMLSFLSIWGGIGAITPAATQAPADMAVYGEP